MTNDFSAASPPEIRRSITLIGLATEFILLVLALSALYFFDLPVNIDLNPRLLWLGAALTLPLLAFNFILFFLIPKRFLPTEFSLFVDNIIKPLCLHLPLRNAAALSALAGVAEELFFRGALDGVLALFFGPAVRLAAGSFIFAYVHFAGRVHSFRVLLSVYFCLGAYFWCSVYYSGSLVPAMLAHGLYDFLAIAFVRWHFRCKNHDQRPLD